MRSPKAGLLIWFLFLCPSLTAGQLLFATLQVERGSVFVGEPFKVWVRVAGTVRPNRPDTSHVRDFEVHYLGRRVRPSVGETRFAFRFIPTRGGSLNIPPLTVEGAGIRTKTPKAKIQVLHQPRTGSSSMVIEIEDLNCFAGQQVLVTVEFKVPESGYRTPKVYLPFLRDKRLKSVLLSGGRPASLPPGLRRILVNEQPAVAAVTKDTSRESFRFQVVVIPTRVAAIDLGTAAVKVDLPRGWHGPRAFATAEAGTLRVGALPPAPKSFSGLIGGYEFSADAEPRTLKLGEPTMLKIRMRGPKYMGDAALPDLENAPTLLRDFKVERIPEGSSTEDEFKVFRYRLRPRRDDIRYIPRLEVTLFEPVKGKFVSRYTQKIPLNVLPNKEVTAADAEGSAPPSILSIRRRAATTTARLVVRSRSCYPQASKSRATCCTRGSGSRSC